jgi:hypothetical protein
LENTVCGKNTMHTLGHNSGSAQLLVAIEQVEVASLCIDGEGNYRLGCLPIPHLLVRRL